MTDKFTDASADNPRNRFVLGNSVEHVINATSQRLRANLVSFFVAEQHRDVSRMMQFVRQMRADITRLEQFRRLLVKSWEFEKKEINRQVGSAK